MANPPLKNFIQTVEIPCKSLRKTPCKSRVKNSGKLFTSTPIRAKLHFPTHFSHFSHPLSHNLITPNVQLFYPHFHTPYYYNYKLFI